MATRFFGAAQPPEPDKDASRRLAPGGTELPALTAIPITTSEHRLALLVGNGRYVQGRLANPVNDVRLVGNVLRALGFAVTVVEDVDKAQLQAAVIAFCVELEKAGPGAVALFYFAGHGIQHLGSNFLLPVGVDIPSTRYLPALAVPADEIVVELTRARRKANVIILDACRNNALPGLEAESRDIMQGLAALKLPPDGMLVAYSTAAGALAEDGHGRQSPYAEALAQALPSLLEPGRRIHDVFVEAAERVKEMTGARQAPALYLQGTLPPLQVDEADRERFRNWVFYEPSWPWWRLFKWTSGGLAAAAIAAATFAWVTAHPELRGLWLHQAGIQRSEAYDFACAPPWDKKDRFGLTRADWCVRPMDDIVRKVKRAGVWDNLVDLGVAASDPKSMALAAGALNMARPARGTTDQARLVSLASRAGRVGLPAAWIVLNSEATRQQVSGAVMRESDALFQAKVKKHLLDAATAGVPSAEFALGWEAVREKDAARAESWVAKADANDPFGHAAAQLGLAYAGRTYPDVLPLDMNRALYWLLHAAGKGNRLAYRFLTAPRAEQQTFMTTQERRQLDDRIIASGGPMAAFVLGRRLLDSGPERDVAEAARQLAIAAEADDDGAMETLTTIYRDGLVSGKPEPAEAIRWLERAAAVGGPRQLFNLGEAYIFGLPDRSGRPLMPLQPEKGEQVLLQADKQGASQQVALTLAVHYEKGTFGRRELKRAAELYRRVVEEGGSSDIVATAQNGLQRLARVDKLKSTQRLPEIGRGDPAATLGVVIYMPILCPTCRDEYRQLVEPGLAALIRRGIAQLQFREWYPEGQVDAASEASLLIRCIPPPERMDMVERFMASYGEWAAASGRDAKLEVLKRLADPTGIASKALEACLTNEQWRDGLLQQGADLVRVFAVNQVPALIVDGQLVVRPTRDQLAQFIVAALPPQIAVRLTGQSKPF